MGPADWIVSIGTIVAIPLVTWLVARSSRRAAAEQEAVKHWQGRALAAEGVVRTQSDYINVLRGHIVDGRQPPPPPWPEGMPR